MFLPRVSCLTQEQKWSTRELGIISAVGPGRADGLDTDPAPPCAGFLSAERGEERGHRVLALVTHSPGARPTALLPWLSLSMCRLRTLPVGRW